MKGYSSHSTGLSESQQLCVETCRTDVTKCDSVNTFPNSLVNFKSISTLPRERERFKDTYCAQGRKHNAPASWNDYLVLLEQCSGLSHCALVWHPNTSGWVRDKCVAWEARGALLQDHQIVVFFVIVLLNVLRQHIQDLHTFTKSKKI